MRYGYCSLLMVVWYSLVIHIRVDHFSYMYMVVCADSKLTYTNLKKKITLSRKNTCAVISSKFTMPFQAYIKFIEREHTVVFIVFYLRKKPTT